MQRGKSTLFAIKLASSGINVLIYVPSLVLIPMLGTFRTHQPTAHAFIFLLCES